MKKATKSTKVTKSVGSRVPRDRKGNVLTAKDAKIAKAVGCDDLIAPRVVLVGTYKGDQLTKWLGWYNYPVSDEDFLAAKNKEQTDLLTPNGVREDVSRVSDEQIRLFESINELWLFNGKKDQRNYKASFVGIKTRQELISDYGYPAKGKAHGDKYLLFKTDFKYQHKGDIPEDAERVIIRTADFATAPKVRKQLKAYLESSDRKDPDLAKRLPTILTNLRPEQLRVCESVVQLNFWDVPEMAFSINATPGIVAKKSHGDAKPFVKWAGGKGQLLEQLDALLPSDFATRQDLISFEPFVDDGTMLFHMFEKYPNITAA